MTTFLKSMNIKESPTLFPDGQPHISYDSKTDPVLRCRITNPLDLMNVAMAIEIRKSHNLPTDLEILYLMGGRSDRRQSPDEPYTLKAVCDIVNSWKCNSITVLCPHSRATIDLLDNYDEHADWSLDEFFDKSILHGLAYFENLKGYTPEEKSSWRDRHDISFVFPDEGACKRFTKSKLIKWWPNAEIVTLKKDRDERTGIIKSIEKSKGSVKKYCFIIDDLCDGGRTFIDAAKILKSKKLGLVVPHSIFNKGLELEGISYIATTNSYCDREPQSNLYVWNYA